MKIFFNSILLVFLAGSGLFYGMSEVRAEASEAAFSVGGTYLGLINFFGVDGRPAGEEKHQQFDFATNIDFGWQIKENVDVTLQLQGGTGGGSLGFAGPETVVTDLTLNFKHAHSGMDMEIVIGSFDTPFGEQTGYLTNNADSFANTLFLNSLFYSAFGGTVGTLNTLGVMGIFETKPVDITLAVTNGGDESALNNGGDFEYVARAVTGALMDGSRFGFSYMMSDDSFSADPSKADGFKSDFEGWMVDGKIEPVSGATLKGYYGAVTYGDHNAATKDEVDIWMGEASYGQTPWLIAVRLSGWEPNDGNGNGAGLSTAIPNPGLTNAWSVGNAPCSGPCPNTDQKILRLQAGGSFQLHNNLVAKLEYVRDDADRRTAGRSTDVDGWLFLLNGRF